MKPAIVIIGVGLMGGSLGMALRQHKYKVIGIGRNLKKLQIAKKTGAVDCFYTDIKYATNADIIVICLPVDKIVETYKKLAEIVSSNAVICDIGSVKYNITKKINKIIKANKNYPHFVGCHPMAGTEKSGIINASPDLYFKKTVVITDKKENKKNLPVVKMWKNVGCNIVYIQPKRHDELVAFTSHLPHIIAFSFYKAFKEKFKKYPEIKSVTAGSFESLTRVAKSSSEIWLPIVKENKQNLKKLISEYSKQINLFSESFGNEKKLKILIDKSIRNDTK